ncbi:MAG: DUF6265 family protein [Woeseiaceae bacterium]|nr:DUF6265 family protein [Woeseiaceae bacterium]
MRLTVGKVLAAALVVALFGTASAQTAVTEHTVRLDDAERRPPATLEDVSWLVGAWKGEAFGGTFEEVWNPPSKGSMIGFFKFMGDDAVGFYELLLLVEEEGSLSLKVKHFNPDFSAWEEKEEHVDFRFVSASEDVIHFSGISFYRMSRNEIHAWIRMRNGDRIGEEKLVYRRVEDLEASTDPS